jgi:formylglycine-generating enzyme required for sulfatase activity
MAFPDSARLAGVAADMTRQARSEIMAAQQGLSAAGFDPGPATGVMTPRTTQAARLYQERAGLPRTGEIDARLLAALAAATGHNSDGALSPGRLHQSREDFRQGGGPLPLSVIQDCRECPALVVLPMGSGQVGDAGADGDPSERPARLVNLDYGLALGQFEVSVAEWDACVDDRGCTHRPRPLGAAHPNAPVVDVSHDDAKHYLAWLRRRTGQGYRLPSEAEWEFAARAGARFTAQSDLALGLCVTGNIADRASPFPLRDETCFDGYANARAPVGQFQPNGFGLFDMTGNVWEWTEDCWHASYQGAPLSPSPWLRGCDSRARVLRGGSFMTGPGHNRISARLGVSAELRLRDVGFRVVRPVAF